MSEIALHIEYLLTKHDCVIVPGWGAFIAQYADAFSFEDSGLYKKPNRFVSFNSSVDHNDGLLVNSIVRKTGVSYDLANREICDFVASFRKQLDYDGSVAIGRVGFFKKDDGLIVFEPYNTVNVCNDVFGLSDLRIKTLAQITKEESSQIEESTNVVRLYGRRFIQVAASIVLLIAACFVLSTPISFDKSTDYAGLDSAVKIKSPQQRVPLVFDGELAIALPKCALNENANKETVAVKTDANNQLNEEKASESAKGNEEVEIPHNADGVYFLIVSSLDTRSQADKFISKHGGDLRVLEMDGRYRVYVAQSNSVKQLSKVKQKLNNIYPDAWVFVQ